MNRTRTQPWKLKQAAANTAQKKPQKHLAQPETAKTLAQQELNLASMEPKKTLAPMGPMKTLAPWGPLEKRTRERKKIRLERKTKSRQKQNQPRPEPQARNDQKHNWGRLQITAHRKNNTQSWHPKTPGKPRPENPETTNHRNQPPEIRTAESTRRSRKKVRGTGWTKGKFTPTWKVVDSLRREAREREGQQDDTLESLREDLKAKDDEIAKAKENLANEKQRRKKQWKIRKRKKRENENLKTKLNEKDQENTDLQTQVANLQAQIDNLNQDYEDLRTTERRKPP